MRLRLGGAAAVVAASGLLAAALVGGPLYVSSSGSEALQIAMSRSCASDTGCALSCRRCPEAARA